MPKYTVEAPSGPSAAIMENVFAALCGAGKVRVTLAEPDPPTPSFYVSKDTGALVAIDNFNTSKEPEQHGRELYVEVTDEASTLHPHGFLASLDSRSMSMPREDAERLYAWLGEWLGVA